MKKDSVLSVLMYLFNNHLQQGEELELRSKDLFKELKLAGFRERSILEAVEWLTSLADMQKYQVAESAVSSLRVFSEEERSYLDTECQSFLLDLVSQDIISWITFELVVHFVMELDGEGIDISLIKWVSLMVLYNMPDEQEALKRMELLVLEDSPAGSLH